MCPKCEKELRQCTIGTVELDECIACEGTWFNNDELRKCKDQTDSDLNWMDFEIWKHKDRFLVSAKPIHCPHCNTEMVAINYDTTDIEIDYCVNCQGVWLDGGEFQKIIEALTDELLTKTVSEYARASLTEAKEIISGPESRISEWKDFLNILRMLQYRALVENPKLNDAIIELQKNLPK